MDSKHYKDWRLKRAKHLRDCCVLCGSKKCLSLHHHTYEEDDSIFATLCKGCHYRVHFTKKGQKRSHKKVKSTLSTLLFKKYLTWRANNLNKISNLPRVTAKSYAKNIGYDGLVKRGTCKP